MLKPKIKDLVASNDLLVKIFDNAGTNNIKLLYRLMFLKKFMVDLASENHPYNQSRTKLFEEYTVSGSAQLEFKGETEEEKTENRETFIKKMTELTDGEVEIKIEPFTMEDMESITLDKKLTPSELFNLFWLLDNKDVEVQQ